MDATGPVDVFYDDWCPMCTGIRTRLERIDTRKKLRFVPIRDGMAAAELGLEVDRLVRRMHVRFAGTSRVVDGIDAVAAIAARVPLLMPLWPIIALSAAVGAGQRLYDLIASRRRIVPVGNCEDGACPIHRQPEKGGRHDS